jgi:raffinose/stachyose/melibiose transport system substrate-binding protein
MSFKLHYRLLAVVLVALLLVPFAVQAQDEDVTLVVWDNFTRESEQAIIEMLNEMFEEQNPGVTVQREAYTTDDLGLLLPRELSNDNGPDVAMINQGLNNMAALVEAGLLLPLDDYAEELGWYELYGENLHNRNRVVEDGSQFGRGNLYGVSNTSEVVAVFYNKRIFEELDLTPPETFEEFEAMLATIEEAGITPITFGNLEGWPGIHTFGAIYHLYVDLADIDAMMYRDEEGTFEAQGAVAAADKMTQWVEAGYFSEGFEGMDNDNAALGEFISEESAMWLAGSWNSGSIVDALGAENVGFFVLPGPDGQYPAPTIGGIGLAYGVRATTENPDLAAAYIDLVTGPEAAELLLAEGFLPAAPVDETLLEAGTLTIELVNAWNLISQEDVVGHYFDWTINDVDSYIQELLAGVREPEGFVEAVEAEYDAE